MRGSWLIDSRIVHAYLPQVANLLNGKPVAFFSEREQQERRERLSMKVITPANKLTSKLTSLDEATPGSVAVIPIQGVIMKEDNCGSPGTSTIKNRVKEASDHPNIGSIILSMDSGGGSVDGTFELADAIRDCSKPVLAFIDGMACSAGYAIVSGAKEIYASHATAEVGSIGTACTLHDNAGALEKWGYKMHYINADSSPDKNQDYFKAMEGDYSTIKGNILNPTNEIFLNTVRQNRAGKINTTKENTLTGKVYLAQAAADFGLIEGIKTFEQAIDRAFSLQSTTANLSHTSMKIIDSIKLFLGITSAEEKVTPTSDQLDKLGLTAVTRSEFDAERAAREKAQCEVTTLKKQVEDLQAENRQLQEKISKSAGGSSTTPVKTGSEGTDPDADMWATLNALPHNKKADALNG